MYQFNQYIENKEIEPLVNKCAQIMVELDVDPWPTILEWASKENPKLEALLLEKANEIELLQEQFMKNLGQGLKQAGQQIWGGLKAAGGQMKNAMFGPQAKYEQAVNSLQALVQVMQSTPELQKLPGIENGNLAKQIKALLGTLQTHANMIPQLMGQQAQNTWQQGGAPQQAPVFVGPGPRQAPSKTPLYGTA